MIMHISIFLVLVSVFSLGFAYISEHVFGLLPCILCIYQRIPFFVVIGIGILSLIFKGKIRLVLVILCGISLLTGAGIALFHVGVEHGTFQLGDGCESTDPKPTSLEELRNQLIGKPAAPCDKPQFVFLGLSMAGWNFFFSGFLGISTLLIVWRKLKEEED